jgi:hypothetical protein
LLQIVWFVWVGVTLLMTKATAPAVDQGSGSVTSQARTPSNNGIERTAPALD